MSRGWKIALGLSVALNLFFVGLVVAAVVIGPRAIRERLGGGPPLFVAAEQLPEAERAVLKARLKAAARGARPDFNAAREARRRTVALASAPTYDRDAVLAAMKTAREAELRGRTRFETGLVDALADLDKPSRQKLAPSLVRPPRGGRGHGRGDRREAPAELPAPPPAD